MTRLLIGRVVFVLGIRIMPIGRYRAALCKTITALDLAVYNYHKMTAWFESNRCTHANCPKCGFVEGLTFIDGELCCGDCRDADEKVPVDPCLCDQPAEAGGSVKLGEQLAGHLSERRQRGQTVH